MPIAIAELLARQLDDAREWTRKLIADLSDRCACNRRIVETEHPVRLLLPLDGEVAPLSRLRTLRACNMVYGGMQARRYVVVSSLAFENVNDADVTNPGNVFKEGAFAVPGTMFSGFGSGVAINPHLEADGVRITGK